MAIVFEQQIRVQAEDLDDLHHVNNVVYLQWVQDIAKAHWAVLSNPEVNRKYAWVVLRHEINYHRPARLDRRESISGDLLVPIIFFKKMAQVQRP